MLADRAKQCGSHERTVLAASGSGVKPGQGERSASEAMAIGASASDMWRRRGSL